jgi:hypothetical protein
MNNKERVSTGTGQNLEFLNGGLSKYTTKFKATFIHLNHWRTTINDSAVKNLPMLGLDQANFGWEEHKEKMSKCGMMLKLDDGAFG